MKIATRSQRESEMMVGSEVRRVSGKLAHLLPNDLRADLAMKSGWVATGGCETVAHTLLHQFDKVEIQPTGRILVKKGDSDSVPQVEPCG